jgi:hypothetical protein
MAKQALLVRHTVGFRIGPQQYSIGIADDRARSWTVSSAKGFTDGAEGFVNGNGIICNDCGLIAPASGALSGAPCDGCRRTLCRRHNWLWPSKGFGWIQPINCVGKSRRLCSTCYGSTHAAADLLDDSHPFLQSLLTMGILGLIPGLPFIVGKRLILGATFLTVFAVALLAPLAFLDDPGAGPAMAVAGVLTCCLASMLSCLNWAARLRLHAKNTDELRGYRAIWE